MLFSCRGFLSCNWLTYEVLPNLLLLLDVNIVACCSIATIFIPIICRCSEVNWSQDWLAIVVITTTKYQGVDITLTRLPSSTKWYIESLKVVFTK